MSIDKINVGNAPDDGQGDRLRDAFIKINENFQELEVDKADKGWVTDEFGDITQGKSAYEVALDNGFVGTETEWLASLKGEKGDGAGIGDAPMDGKIYGRSDADWVEVTGGGGGGGSFGIDFKVRTVTPTSITSSSGRPVIIDYTWSSIDMVDESSTGIGSLLVTINSATLLNTTIEQGSRSIAIPSNRLISGSNTVVVRVTDSYGNSRSLTYNVQIITLNISSTYNPITINNGDIIFLYTPIGDVEKTIHFIVDDVELEPVVTSFTNRQLTYIIPALPHGTHSLRVYMEAEIDGGTVYSNELFYDIISIEEGNNTPLISLPLTTANIDQFGTIKIPYVVYTPGNVNSDVTLSVDGVELSSLIVSRGQQYWNYKANNAGTEVLTITTGSVSKSFTLVVTPSEIDVEAETLDLDLYLTSQNRSNNELNKEQWSYKGINASLTGFNFVNNGWVSDSEGSTVLRVDNGARVVIPYKPFTKDVKGSGQTIEFEFKTRAISLPDVTLISAMSGNVGFKIETNTTYFNSQQTGLSTKYKEEERIRISILITKVPDGRLIELYVNGIMSSLQQYPLLDSFIQANPSDIIIGSDDAGIDIYNIRIYSNNLNQYQLLDNYIADLDRIEEKSEVFLRNDIYDSFGNLDYAKANEFIPCLTIIGSLPTFKGDKLNRSFEYSNLQDPSKSFTADGQIDVQGTSSQYYPRKNWKIKFSEFKYLDGETTPKYQLREDSVPETTFTMKADFAESSGTHNTGMAVFIGYALDELGYKTPPQYEDANIRTTVDGFPILIFHKLTPDAPRVFTGKYNFNNDKTDATFGFTGDGSTIQSWETLNNTSDRVLFKSADFTSLDGDGEPDWLNDFEARFPDGYEDPTKLERLVSWVASTQGNPTKFLNEYEDYFDKDFLVFYYVITELFAMVDQRGKNQFLTVFPTEDGDRWYQIFYDNDTVLGINNEGAIAFGYDVEYHDLVGSGYAFNAESSVLFNMIEQTLQPEIEALYVKLRADGIVTYEKMLEFLNVQQSDKWSESIYNEDSEFKYLLPLLEDGIGAYLYAAQGSREEFRKWWLFNRIHYMDSKYQAASNRTDYVSMRLYTPSVWNGVAPDADFYLTPFGLGYATVKYGSYLVKKRLVKGQVNYIDAPEITFNDTETIVYGASFLSSLGDLSGKYIGTLDASKGVNLTELIIGSTVEGYQNLNLTSLSLGNNTLLKKLNIANTPALTQSVDLTGCTSIEEIIATGSGISSVQLPEAGNLTILSLPAVSALILKNQSKLTNETLTLDSYDNLTTLVLENCTLIDPFEILDKSPNLNAIRFVGLNGSSNSVDAFNRALTLGGVDEYGVATPYSVLEGSWHFNTITQDELDAFESNWENLNITYDYIAGHIYSVINNPTISAFPANPDFLLTSSIDVNLAIRFGSETVYADMVANQMKVVKPPLDYVIGNTPVDIYGGSLLYDLGSNLPRKYFSSLDVSKAPNFQQLILGDVTVGYVNTFFTSLEIGETDTLEVLNIAGTPNLNINLDLSGATGLKELQATRSGITGVILPETNTLTNLSLPAMDNLTIKGQSLIFSSNIVMDGYTNLNKLVLEDTPNINMPTFFDKLSGSPLTNVRLTGLNVLSPDVNLLNRLASLGGVDENGNNIPQSYLEGKWVINIARLKRLNELRAIWEDLDLDATTIVETIEFESKQIEDALVAEFGVGVLTEALIGTISAFPSTLFIDITVPQPFPEFELFTGITETQSSSSGFIPPIQGALLLPPSLVNWKNNTSLRDTTELTHIGNTSQLTYIGDSTTISSDSNYSYDGLYPNLTYLGGNTFFTGNNRNKYVGEDIDLNFTGSTFTELKNNSINLSHLRSLVLPNTLTIIRLAALTANQGRVSGDGIELNIPDSVITIETSIFNNVLTVTHLDKLTLGNSVQTIGRRAFRNSNNITSYPLGILEIPASVTDIGEEAFDNVNFSGFELKGTVPPSIGINAFGSLPFSDSTKFIFVPDASLEVYKTATNWSYYATKILPASSRP